MTDIAKQLRDRLSNMPSNEKKSTTKASTMTFEQLRNEVRKVRETFSEAELQSGFNTQVQL